MSESLFGRYEQDGVLYFPEELEIAQTPRADEIERGFHYAEAVAEAADPIAEMRRNITQALNASRREYANSTQQESDLWDNDDRELVEA